MSSSWKVRFGFLIFVILLSGLALVPTFLKTGPDTKLPIKSKMNLGLDLQGGLYIVLGIDFNKVYKDELKTNLLKVESLLKDSDIVSSIGDYNLTDPTDPKLSLKLVSGGSIDQVKTKVKEFYQTILRPTGETENTIEYGLQTNFKLDLEKNSVGKSIEVIRNRIDEFGVTEPEIVSLGKNRIVVQLPGVKDVERAKDLIGKTAKLEFKIVNSEVSTTQLDQWVKKAKDAGIVYKKGERFSSFIMNLNEHLKNDLPKGFEIAFEREINKVNNEVIKEIPYLVESTSQITGEDLQDAFVQIDQQENRPYVGLTFNSLGAKRFEDVTGKNVGKAMAIVLDGNVYSAPVINGKIAGGSAQITLGYGDYDKVLSEAKDLSLVLRAGALPVELDFQEQRIVGPSLGADAISKANKATIIACLALFILVIFYYKASGMIAVVTLMINVLVILASLVGIDATLTLPGIAGIALTVGMAVDGNIIIYERIKEELAKGVSVDAAIDAGFNRAFWTLIDANLTTAASGLALLNFGTGPVRGFAVTLLIGIVATIYTSYFVSEVFFEWFFNRKKLQALSI